VPTIGQDPVLAEPAARGSMCIPFRNRCHGRSNDRNRSQRQDGGLGSETRREESSDEGANRDHGG
jgi:hypothetical protein